MAEAEQNNQVGEKNNKKETLGPTPACCVHMNPLWRFLSLDFF